MVLFPFSQSLTPAVRTYLDAQTAFMNDVSKSFFKSFHQMCELNIHFAQAMLEESTLAGQQLISAERQSDLLGTVAARSQPATDKLRAYQQHVSRLAPDAGVDIARVAEQHVQNTTRTARAVADELARNVGEDAERGLRGQQETLRQFGETLQRSGESALRAADATGADGKGQRNVAAL